MRLLITIVVFLQSLLNMLTDLLEEIHISLNVSEMFAKRMIMNRDKFKE
jgi:hypothetical protein